MSPLLQRLVRDDSGQTIVEYGLLLMLVAIVVIAMIIGVGQSSNNMYSTINSSVVSATSMSK